MVQEGTLKTKKIQIYPNKYQRNIFNIWFGISRIVYNYALKWYCDNKIYKRPTASIRNSIYQLINKNYILKLAPFHIKNYAIIDAYNTMCALRKKCKQPVFTKNRFRTKRNNVQSLTVRKEDVKQRTIYPKTIGKSIKSSEDWGNIEHECNIIQEYNRYYICIPVSLDIKSKNQRFNICALDPGVRIFQTIYSPEGYTCIGGNTYKKIFKINKKIDNLTSLLNIQFTKKRHNKIIKLRYKLRCLIDELHWKTIAFLCKNYKYIIIPEFKVQSFSKKYKLSKTVNRLTRILAHYRFKQRLLHKAREYNSKVIITTEEYSSISCTNCGIINKINKNRELNCKNCNLFIDRDVNGARNIYLSTLYG